MPMLNDIADMVKFIRDDKTGNFGVVWPSTRQVQRYLNEQGIRQPVPEAEDPFWDDVRVIVGKQSYAMRVMAIGASTYGKGELLAPIPSARTSSPVNDETTLREMKGPQIAATLIALGLKVEPHPTNAGITVMRGKNLLLLHVRRGGSLDPAPAKNKPKWTVS
jgi:hypothetical protein